MHCKFIFSESKKDLNSKFLDKNLGKAHGWHTQNRALAVEARRIGIPVFVEGTPVARVYGRTAVTWRHEVVTVKGKSQVRYRDLKTGRFIKKPK